MMMNKEEDKFINAQNKMNNATAILVMGASNDHENVWGFVGWKTRKKIPHNGKMDNSMSYNTNYKDTRNK